MPQRDIPMLFKNNDVKSVTGAADLLSRFFPMKNGVSDDLSTVIIVEGKKKVNIGKKGWSSRSMQLRTREQKIQRNQGSYLV